MTLLRTTFALTAAAALSFVTFTPSNARAQDSWGIDAGHSHVGFKVRHMTVSWVRGVFAKVDGTIKYDGKDIENLSADVTIGVESIDTKNEKRHGDHQDQPPRLRPDLERDAGDRRPGRG